MYVVMHMIRGPKNEIRAIVIERKCGSRWLRYVWHCTGWMGVTTTILKLQGVARKAVLIVSNCTRTSRSSLFSYVSFKQKQQKGISEVTIVMLRARTKEGPQSAIDDYALY